MIGFLKRNKLWLKIITFMYSIAILILITAGKVWAVKFLGYLAITFLLLTLIPKRVGYWIKTPESIVKKYMIKAIIMRRDFGITAGMLMIVHVAIAMQYYGNLKLTFYFKPAILPAFISELIIFSLLFTSGTFLTKKLGKAWKPLHRLIWVVVPLLFVHIKEANEVYDPIRNTHGLANILLLSLGFIALFDLILSLRRKEPIKSQLMTFVYIILGMIILVFI